jgi:hypothetical protein
MVTLALAPVVTTTVVSAIADSFWHTTPPVPAGSPADLSEPIALMQTVTVFVPLNPAAADAVAVAHARPEANAVTFADAVAVAETVPVAVAVATALTKLSVNAVAVAVPVAPAASAFAVWLASATAVEVPLDVDFAAEVTALVAVDFARAAPVDVATALMDADAYEVDEAGAVAVAVDILAFVEIAVECAPEAAVDVAVSDPCAYALTGAVAVAQFNATAHAELAVASTTVANGSVSLAVSTLSWQSELRAGAAGASSWRWYFCPRTFVAANLAVMATGVSNKLIIAKENFMMIDDD